MLVGLELAPLMGSEIAQPRRVIPRAIVIGGVLIVAFYGLGTTALLVALPAEQIGSITGIAEAGNAIAERLGLAIAGPVFAFAMALASMGVLAAWVAGSARLPYVVGIEKHLPVALGSLHPRWRTPHVALLTSGLVTTALVAISLMGSGVGAAYQFLVDMTVVLTFIPIAYLFAALPVLRKRRSGERPGLLRVPGGRIGVAAVAVLGLGSTLVAIGCALVPPDDADTVTFYTKAIGGCAAFLALGLAIYLPSGQRTAENVRGTSWREPVVKGRGDDPDGRCYVRKRLAGR